MTMLKKDKKTIIPTTIVFGHPMKSHHLQKEMIKILDLQIVLNCLSWVLNMQMLKVS